MATVVCASLLALAFLLPTSHAAWHQYRCQGRIQYSPCLGRPALPNPRPRAQPPSTLAHKNAGARPKGQLYARVLSQTFTRLPGQDGVWKGVVQGNGDVRLQIHFLKNGIVQNTRYMGHVILANKSTTFKFRTVAPPGDDWTWRITASAS